MSDQGELGGVSTTIVVRPTVRDRTATLSHSRPSSHPVPQQYETSVFSACFSPLVNWLRSRSESVYIASLRVHIVLLNWLIDLIKDSCVEIGVVDLYVTYSRLRRRK